jgi:hypothetical protein
MSVGDPGVVLPVKAEENASNRYHEFHCNSGGAESSVISSVSNVIGGEHLADLSLDYRGR